MAEQNCEIRESVDEDGSAFHWIDYCPLHAAAPKMAEMLKDVQGYFEDDGGPYVLVKRIKALLDKIQGSGS